MTRRQRKRQQARRVHAKTNSKTMLDPNWTPERGAGHAWAIMRKLGLVKS